MSNFYYSNIGCYVVRPIRRTFVPLTPNEKITKNGEYMHLGYHGLSQKSQIFRGRVCWVVKQNVSIFKHWTTFKHPISDSTSCI